MPTPSDRSRWQVIGERQHEDPRYKEVLDQFERWKSGEPKNVIEREDYNDAKSHGKLMSKLFREVLGIETEASSALQRRYDAKCEELRKANRRIEDLLQEVRQLRRTPH